jgi:hypothetical protein
MPCQDSPARSVDRRVTRTLLVLFSTIPLRAASLSMTSKIKKRNKQGKATGDAVKRVGFTLPEDTTASPNATTASTNSSSSAKNKGAKVREGLAKLAAAPKIRPPGAEPAIPHGAGLSRGQLAVVIVLALAVARLMQVGTAATAPIGGGGGALNETITAEDSAARASKTCVEHLGEAACSQPSIKALLKYKYVLGMQSLVYVASVAVSSWRTELLLQTLCAFLCLLLGLFGAALFLSLSGMRTGVYSNAVMCLVLTAVALPGERIPRQRTSSYRTLQSLCLLSLAIPHLYEAIPLFRGHYLDNEQEGGAETNTDLGFAPSFRSARILHTTDEGFWNSHRPAVDAVVNFVLFDRVAMILMLMFAWYYLPNLKQRVRSIMNRIRW